MSDDQLKALFVAYCDATGSSGACEKTLKQMCIAGNVLGTHLTTTELLVKFRKVVGKERFLRPIVPIQYSHLPLFHNDLQLYSYIYNMPQFHYPLHIY